MNKYDKFVGLFGKFYDENDIKKEVLYSIETTLEMGK